MKKLFSNLNVIASIFLLVGIKNLYDSGIGIYAIAGGGRELSGAVPAFVRYGALIIILLNILLGVMWIASSIGILRRREWGRIISLRMIWLIFILGFGFYIFSQIIGLTNVTAGKLSFVQFFLGMLGGALTLYMLFKIIRYFSSGKVKKQFLQNTNKENPI